MFATQLHVYNTRLSESVHFVNLYLIPDIFRNSYFLFISHISRFSEFFTFSLGLLSEEPLKVCPILVRRFGRDEVNVHLKVPSVPDEAQ